jgi:hypothetical protein
MSFHACEVRTLQELATSISGDVPPGLSKARLSEVAR